MADLDASTPRVFIARHGKRNTHTKICRTCLLTSIGETEWTKNGRYTGSTELLLTPDGEKQVSGTASHLVGSGKLIDPARVVKIFVSPRKRAQQTFTLLFGDAMGEGMQDEEGVDQEGKVVLEEDITEWDHGMYEGWLGSEIRASRKERGIDQGGKEWSIWSDGCEDGE